MSTWKEDEFKAALQEIKDGVWDGTLNEQQIGTFARDVLSSVEEGKRFCTAKTVHDGMCEFIVDDRP